MPFSYLSTQQFKKLCQQKSLVELKNLNHRYGDLFEKIGQNETNIYNQITSIDDEITTIQLKIDEANVFQEQARAYRQNILDNLPSGRTEKRSVLQIVTYEFDYTQLAMQEKLHKLKYQKSTLTQRLNRLSAEFRTCVQELRIVNAVIEEKEHNLTTLKQPSQN
ncbi:Uncharacterised protein [Legionella busanensis]|uniref:Coiled-coil protein n=1 Tax=Legionella busanensis TaxID=190655 RepID=A0A378JMY8_9GAMM|nr:hypothetical protein [Legionella busanensis]STX52437.1 Uncharacterised protein [Legionella busanensis]